MGRPKYLLFTRGKVFAAADLVDSATFKAALLAAFLLSRTDDNKVFCFPLMRVADDNTADAKTETLADGYEEVLNESLAAYTLQSTCGVCQHQGMVLFNGWTDPVYVVDDKNILWYVSTATDGAQGWSVGNLYTTPPRFGNSSNIVTSKTKIVFGTVDEFKSGVGAIKIDFDPTKLANTVDVPLSEAAAATGYAFKIKGKQLCAGTDIYASYKTLLDQTGAWKATTAAGLAVVISSAAHDDATSSWIVTLASSPTIAATTKIKIELVDPTALAALTSPVLGIESVAVTVAKP
jgi:hypothetical protein